MKIMGPKGQPVEAEQQHFKPIHEPWSEYELEDGKILKIRIIVSEIYKLDEVDKVTGRNAYMVKSDNIVSMEEPTKKK
jgi:hypothetical protein